MDSQTRKTKPKYEMIKETLLARIHAGDFSFDESRIWNSRGFCTGSAVLEALFREVFHRTAKQPIRRK